MSRPNVRIHLNLDPVPPPQNLDLAAILPEIAGMQDRTVQALCFRTTLRVMPMVLDGLPRLEEHRHPSNIMAVLYAMIWAGVRARFPLEHVGLPNAVSIEGDPGQKGSRSLAFLLRLTGYLSREHRDQIAVACIDAAVSDRKHARREFSYDFRLAKRNRVGRLRSDKLWSRGRRMQRAAFNEPFHGGMPDHAWSFWREWYQGFLDGKPLDW